MNPIDGDSATATRPAVTAFAPPVASQIALDVARIDAVGAAKLLEEHDDEVVLDVLQSINPATATDIIEALSDHRRDRILAAGPASVTQQWSMNQLYPDDTVGRLMEPPVGVFAPDDLVGQASDRIRELARHVMITYGFVVDRAGRLVGVVTMRDLLVSDDSARLEDVMLRDVFSLRPALPVIDAMKQVLNRHYPVYPVCDDGGRLIGLVRGQALFQEHAFQLSAQPGTMVGVDKEERLVTPWPRSLRFRHPWLQLNLFTAFIAAAVVGVFQTTLDNLVILALFLPVLAGQSGNTGCQALAVTLRGLTLGELRSGTARPLVVKEARLGFLNGCLVGLTAGAGMYLVARAQDNPAAWTLAFIVTLAMIGSCVVSGIAGAIIPLALRRFGADPATASSIFLTTATDVVSMGMFLGLATMLLM